MTVSVLIVDDQAMVRAGFAAILDAQPDLTVVGQAADGAEGVALSQRLRPRRGTDGRPDARAERARGDPAAHVTAAPR